MSIGIQGPSRETGTFQSAWLHMGHDNNTCENVLATTEINEQSIETCRCLSLLLRPAQQSRDKRSFEATAQRTIYDKDKVAKVEMIMLKATCGWV